MTVKLSTFTFVNEPQIDVGIDEDLADKRKFGGGTTFDGVGHGALKITLSGMLTGANAHSDRDTLIGLLKGDAKVDFYADTIGYGSIESPKSVWIKSMGFNHPVGKLNQVPYTIVLLEET